MRTEAIITDTRTYLTMDGPMEDVVLKQYDRLPVLTATLKDVNGPIDLSGAGTTVAFKMRAHDGDLVVNAAATIVTAVSGIVSYAWAAADTDEAGEFDGEFECTIGGKTLTVPNDRSIQIKIVEDLDDH